MRDRAPATPPPLARAQGPLRCCVPTTLLLLGTRATTSIHPISEWTRDIRDRLHLALHTLSALSPSRRNSLSSRVLLGPPSHSVFRYLGIQTSRSLADETSAETRVASRRCAPVRLGALAPVFFFLAGLGLSVHTQGLLHPLRACPRRSRRSGTGHTNARQIRDTTRTALGPLPLLPRTSHARSLRPGPRSSRVCTRVVEKLPGTQHDWDEHARSAPRRSRTPQDSVSLAQSIRVLVPISTPCLLW
ncbi:hypothetical protein AcW2_000233 [Taiwanofungus camphoratus]|nr:hypothetical protein AcW2_000233 [Antrodia cinnamomea]